MNDDSSGDKSELIEGLAEYPQQQGGNKENRNNSYAGIVGPGHGGSGNQYIGVLVRSIDAGINVVLTVVINMHGYRRLAAIKTQVQMSAASHQQQRCAEQHQQAGFGRQLAHMPKISHRDLASHRSACVVICGLQSRRMKLTSTRPFAPNIHEPMPLTRLTISAPQNADQKLVT